MKESTPNLAIWRSISGAPPGTRTLGPLIKRNQGATIVNFQNHADSLFLSFHRKFQFCICCILCTCYPLLHLLSSRSGVQKVCKNVQSQNQPLKTGIGFLCKAGKTAGFEPKTAAEISPVQTKHQMYIKNYDSWQGFGQLRSLINPKQLFLCGLFWVEIPRGFTFLFYRQPDCCFCPAGDVLPEHCPAAMSSGNLLHYI